MASSPGSDPASESDRPHRVEVEGAGEGAVVSAVVEAIAAVRDVEPMELDVRLNDHVDADALERLYRHAREDARGDLRLQFEVDGFVVGVRSDGLVTVI